VIWAWPSAVGEPQLAAQCGCAADQAGAASLVTTVLETPEGRWSLEAFFVDVAIGEHERAGARELASLLAMAIDAGAAERRMLDAELVAERQARQQHVAAELGLHALEGMPIDELMDSAARMMAEALDADVVGIAEVLRGGRVVLRAGYGMLGPLGSVYPLADSTVAFVLENEGPVVVDDWLTEPRWPYPALLKRAGKRSSIAVRIPGRARAYGSIAAHAVTAGRFSADDGGFAQQVANVLGAALDRERGQRALARAEHRRRDVVAHLLREADEERAWIATELHNDTIQAMTAALLSIDRQVKAADAAGEGRLAEISALVRETLTDAVDRTRRLTFELHPQLLGAKGLQEAVLVLVEDQAQAAGLELELLVEVGRHTAPIESLAYRVVRELVANVEQHADATRLMVALTERDGRLEGTVTDDGCGFDSGAATSRERRRAGSGLSATAERLRLAGGRFDVASRPGEGTTVRFSIPVR
jgi:signal transduction histidine kinase